MNKSDQSKRSMNKELMDALKELLVVITRDELLPESIWQMKQARAALAKASHE